ncbi:excitatory amino acid transporter-like isoform X2 [Crassostrea virginica]
MDDFIETIKMEKSFCSKFHRVMRDQILFVLTILAVVIGFVVGFGIREIEPSSDVVDWLGMPGDLFLRLLKMMIVPLVVTSVIHSTASLDPKSNGRVGMISFTYIILTNMMGCAVGISLFYIIKPGQMLKDKNDEPSLKKIQSQDIFADLLRNAIPDNIVEAAFRKTQTKYETEIVRNVGNFTNASVPDVNQWTRTIVKSVGKSDGPNILGLILACMFIGIAAGKFREKGRVFLDFFAVSAEIVLQVFRWFLWLAPVGVVSLTAASIAGTRDASNTFLSLGYFVLTVALGIFVNQFICHPLLYFIFIRKNPCNYILSFKKAWLVGFASGSSALAMPDLLHACEIVNKIDRRIARFVIPLCCTMNADGSALFITTAAMFIANITGYALTFGNVIIIGVLTALSTSAMPAVPSASIVTLVMVLTAINVPVHAVSLLFAVEWFMDRIRTGCNVESHSVCAAISNKYCSRPSAMTEGNVEDDTDEVLTLVVSSKA